MPGALLLVLVLGIVALLVGFSRWLAHRPWAAAGNLAVALLLFTICIVIAPPARHLATYEALRDGTTIGQLHCEQTGPGAWRVTLTRLPGGRMQVFEMRGEQWRIEARTLVWKGRAAALGLAPSWRLERLSARFVDADAGDQAPALQASARTPALASYSLRGDEAGTDVWSRAHAGLWNRLLDAGRAEGAWQPLFDGARFDVVMTWPPAASAARLDVKPANEAGAKAMRYTEDAKDVRTSKG